MSDEYLNKPVFFCGHRKTGTTLLINLFDGVKDAVVFPDDSTFFYMYYPRYVGEEFSNEIKKERLVDILIGEVHKSKIGKANCSDMEREVLMKRLRNFQKIIRDYEGDDYSLKSVLCRFIKAYNDSFLFLEKPKVWIEKTTSTEIYALELSRVFPESKFVHIIRDPRDNWASLLSGWEKRYKNFNDDTRRLKQSLIERGKLGMEMGISNSDTIGESRYKIIKFEGLTRHPVETLKSITELIGIEYSDTLLYPSTFGFKWEGNNFEGVKHSGPSDINVNKWKTRIPKFDAMLIEYHFRDIMDHFGYERYFDTADTQTAALEHYKWFNFSTPYSAK